MSQEAGVPADHARPYSPKVRIPGQAWINGSLSRSDLFEVTELSWARDVEELCLQPPNALPTKRVLPLGAPLW